MTILPGTPFIYISKVQILRICRALRSKILSFTTSAQANKLPCVANL